MVIKITDPDNWYEVPTYTDLRESKGYDWVIIRNRILERDKATCVYCGKKEGQMHIDHILPQSRGGQDIDTNLVCACQHCNCSKGDKTPEEWLNG